MTALASPPDMADEAFFSPATQQQQQQDSQTAEQNAGVSQMMAQMMQMVMGQVDASAQPFQLPSQYWSPGVTQLAP